MRQHDRHNSPWHHHNQAQIYAYLAEAERLRAEGIHTAREAAIVTATADRLRTDKARRQLIILTHNANILINGDAEWVLTMDFHIKLDLLREVTV